MSNAAECAKGGTKKGYYYLTAAVYGNGVGEYDKQYGLRLRQALRELENSQQENPAVNIAVRGDNRKMIPVDGKEVKAAAGQHSEGWICTAAI